MKQKSLNKLKTAVFLFLGGLLFSSCSPVDYLQLKEGSGSDTKGFQVASRGENASLSSKEFKARSKLDIVLVLDVSEKMKPFYEENHLLGENFLARIENHDWRLAYTNTTVNPQLFQMSEIPKLESGEPDPCSLLDMGITVVGAGLAVFFPKFLLASPALFGTAADSTINTAGCGLSKLSGEKEEEEPEPIYANGQFQSFELSGLKKSHTWLNPGVENYEKMFLDSFEWSSLSPTFDAPVSKEDKAFPMGATLLSLDHGFQRNGGMVLSNGEVTEDKFFREDSLVVYVLVTMADSRPEITADSFKKTIQSYFKDENRFEFLPVVFYPLEGDGGGGNPDCRQAHLATFTGKDSPNLIELTKSTYPDKLPPIELCLPDVRQEIYGRSLGDQIYDRIQPKLIELKVLEAQVQ